MYKIKELEKKWFHYKFKKLSSPLLSFSVLFVVVGFAYSLYAKKIDVLFFLPLGEKKTDVLGVNMEVNSSDVKKESTQKKQELQPRVNINQVVEQIALDPIIPVIDMEKEERISATSSSNTKKESHLVKAKANTYLTVKELALMGKHEQVVNNRRTKKINFQSTNLNYIETIKEKFLKSNNPREALLLAKAYYKENNYKEAEEWALSANKLNNSLEESWLIFAKAKVKLGKKEEALSILVSYYKKSHSPKAKRLIGKIKTGAL